MFFEDPSSFMADFGSPVIFGAHTTMALLDQPDADVISGRVQSTQYRIEYPVGDLPGLTNNSEVLVGIGPGWGFDETGKRLKYSGNCQFPQSATFKVLGVPSKLDDGLFVEARLQRL